MLKESKQALGDRIVVLEKRVACLEGENSSLQQLLRISIVDTAKLKAEKETAVKQLSDVQVPNANVNYAEMRFEMSQPRCPDVAAAGWVRDVVMQESTRDELVQLRDGIAAGGPVVFDAVVGDGSRVANVVIALTFIPPPLTTISSASPRRPTERRSHPPQRVRRARRSKRRRNHAPGCLHCTRHAAPACGS